MIYLNIVLLLAFVLKKIEIRDIHLMYISLYIFLYLFFDVCLKYFHYSRLDYWQRTAAKALCIIVSTDACYCLGNLDFS